MPITDSPLRYPGGKTQMKKFLIDLLDYNKIGRNITYVEPFAGGAGLALYLLFNSRVSNICINDYDPSIYAMWYSVLNYTDEFIDMINNTPVTIHSWNYLKTVYENPQDHSILRLGFATFFLNRTNRSGIITGGPIGGHDQSAKYKIDCRFNKKNLVKKIKKIANVKDHIHLYNKDAEVFIKENIFHMPPKDTFIFFDPPYYKQGKNLYANFYNHKNHYQLSRDITELKGHYWITTYDNVQPIRNIYQDHSVISYSINYSANKIRKEEELLIHSKNILLPQSNNITYTESMVI
ncbi:DNA adenine methylase [Halobacillus kuroshimensis]|uniref:site-specific DNA-methyltransferase (adenine-specific) n=1 Tax=Halobacillus kuroshimensis TaxID=302481 RepID=A0ABS3DZW0_9BACI|nr:DNA adenine methylase [Halobacillus kuroshimensis]MBN8236864.1 DNA adenine methylase [Halobacillus kuroshimensis]